MTIDPATLDKWQAVCDAIPEPEWFAEQTGDGWAITYQDHPPFGGSYEEPPDDGRQCIHSASKDWNYGVFTEGDARFIALARTALPLAIAALRERAWRPIEEAPKDGTPILAFVPSYYQGTGGIIVAVYLHDEWMDNKAWATTPTHWIPLPAPPAPPQQEGTP